MADIGEEAGFWLPSEFLDDFLTDKENLAASDAVSETDFFPSEFPYEFEPHSQKLPKNCWMMSTSPQSTLVRKDGFLSPPATQSGAQNDAARVLITKLKGENVHGVAQNKSLLCVSRGQQQIYPQFRNPSKPVFRNNNWYGERQMYQMRGERAEDAWFSYPNPTRIVGSGGYGAVVKKECAGTGVFLPRRYETYSDCRNCGLDSRKQTGYSAPFVPERKVYKLNNKNFQFMNDLAALEQHHPQPKFSRGFISDYDLVMARWNALTLQRRL